MKNKQVESIRNSFFKLSIGHFMQGVAYIILLVIMIIVYFNTTETTKDLSISNISYSNLEEAGTKLKETINLMKYGSIASLIILVISTFYLSSIDVKVIDEVKEVSK